jgi:hypothetical protein
VLWDFLEFLKLFYYRKIYGIGLQPQGLGPWALAHESTGLIKRRSLVDGSMTHIKTHEGVSNNLIVAVNVRMDGSR